MRLRHVALLLGVLLGFARPAAAASITVDSLWAYPTTFFSLWANDLRLVSPDSTASRPENYVDVPIGVANPLEGFTSRTWTLPASLGQGFIYGGLTMGGPLPNDSGWSLGPDDLFAGDLIGLGTTVMDIWWPLGATDGGPISILRVTYTSDGSGDLGVDVGVPVQETPEPSSLALLTVGGAMLVWRRLRH